MFTDYWDYLQDFANHHIYIHLQEFIIYSYDLLTTHNWKSLLQDFIPPEKVSELQKRDEVTLQMTGIVLHIR